MRSVKLAVGSSVRPDRQRRECARSNRQRLPRVGQTGSGARVRSVKPAVGSTPLGQTGSGASALGQTGSGFHALGQTGSGRECARSNRQWVPRVRPDRQRRECARSNRQWVKALGQTGSGARRSVKPAAGSTREGQTGSGLFTR